MERLLNLFDYIPSLFGTFVAWLVFLVGIGVGLVITWPFRRRKDKDLSDLVDLVQTELRAVDSEVDKLWSMTFPPNRCRVSSQRIDSPLTDRRTASLMNLLQIKKQLHSLQENLAIILNAKSWPPKNTESFTNIADYSLKPRVVVQPSPAKHVQHSSPAPDSDFEGVTIVPVARNTQHAMVEFYNRAVNDPVERERFREDYSPIRVGTVNAVERRQNPTIKAEIRETSDGDFFALPIEGTEDFAVFPRLGLTIEAVSYTAGAIGEVFDKTRDHDPRLYYSSYRVKQPAIFRFEGGRWQLRKPGELELGVGE